MGKSANFSDAFRFLWEYELRDQSVEPQDPLIFRSQILETRETALATPNSPEKGNTSSVLLWSNLYSLAVNKAVFQIKQGES